MFGFFHLVPVITELKKTEIFYLPNLQINEDVCYTARIVINVNLYGMVDFK